MKKIIQNATLGLFATIFIASCAGVRPIASVEDEETSRAVQNQPVTDGPIEVTVASGKITFVNFPFRKPDGSYSMKCGDTTIRFMAENDTAKVYLPANYFAKAGQVDCVYQDEEGELLLVDLKIEEFDYPKERLNVAKGKVDYSKKDLERILREQKITKKIYLDSADTFLFDRPFIRPLDSFVTSYYGNQRLFNNKKRSQHLGNDLRAPTGTEIPSANRGRVVFTGDLFFSGKVVVIDHGMDIFTMYGHLSKILVTEGSVVNQGDIVGLSGATGRVSGPHLHWGTKVNGSWIDGFALVEASKQHLGASDDR